MISTHILDTSLGRPAVGVSVELDFQEADTKEPALWTRLERASTNTDGRIVFSSPPRAGNYRLCFQINDYFTKNKQPLFFLSAPVIFQVQDLTRKYHVPLLLNPYGYSTYRGS